MFYQCFSEWIEIGIVTKTHTNTYNTVDETHNKNNNTKLIHNFSGIYSL